MFGENNFFKDFFLRGGIEGLMEGGPSANSPIIYSRLIHSRLAPKNQKVEKNHQNVKKRKKLIVSLQPNISDMPFHQKSPQPPEEGALEHLRQTDKQTYIWTSQLYD